MKLVYFERFHGDVQDAKNRTIFFPSLSYNFFENCDLPVIVNTLRKKPLNRDTKKSQMVHFIIHLTALNTLGP